MSARTLRIAFAVSLICNLFLVGALAGGAAWLRGRSGMIAAGSLRVAGSELPPDVRRSFKAALRDARRSVHGAAEDGIQARAQAGALLRAPTLDQAALDATLARIRQDDFAVRMAVERRAVIIAGTLKPEHRARLAEAIVRRNARPVSLH